MKDYRRILKFTANGTYEDVRKMADKMILSIVVNDKKSYTCVSTVTLSPIGKLMQFKEMSRMTSSLAKMYNWDKEELKYTVRIYQMYGNRKSALSISENEELLKVVIKSSD